MRKIYGIHLSILHFCAHTQYTSVFSLCRARMAIYHQPSCTSHNFEQFETSKTFCPKTHTFQNTNTNSKIHTCILSLLCQDGNISPTQCFPIQKIQNTLSKNTYFQKYRCKSKIHICILSLPCQDGNISPTLVAPSTIFHNSKFLKKSLFFFFLIGNIFHPRPCSFFKVQTFLIFIIVRKTEWPCCIALQR